MIRQRRQPAIRLLAAEFNDVSLQDRGSGEFDPSFLITKLGARVNRVLICGLLERLEPRETSNGSTMWQGAIRDPSGLFYFGVGDYAPESAQVAVQELEGTLEEGTPTLVMMTAKASMYETDDGSIFTNLRPEELTVVDRTAYLSHLATICDATLERISAFEGRVSPDGIDALEPLDGVTKGADGIGLALAHYGVSDTEVLRFHVRRALDIIEGRHDITSESPPPPESNTDVVPSAGTNQELEAHLLEVVRAFDKGEGVSLMTMVKNASARGWNEVEAEEMIDALHERGELVELRFGIYAPSNSGS